MKYVFCIMQTYVLLAALLQVYQSKPNLPEKTDGYRKKRTSTGKNGQVPEKTDGYRKKWENYRKNFRKSGKITGKIVYIPHYDGHNQVFAPFPDAMIFFVQQNPTIVHSRFFTIFFSLKVAESEKSSYNIASSILTIRKFD